jgi:uncharacterized protein YdhG (YjbR/CyaY superfamily)
LALHGLSLPGRRYGPRFRNRLTTLSGDLAAAKRLEQHPGASAIAGRLRRVGRGWASELTGYEGTKGSLHFAIDEPLPRDLVDKLLTTRMKQLGLL